jgi:hypothetical protein
LRRLEGRAKGALDRIDPRAALGVALTASGALLLLWLSHLSFSGDEWDYLLDRRGFNLEVLLRPHVQHVVLGPVLIYKAIQATLGMERLLPYAVVSTASFLTSVVLLFAYLRRHVGEWLALAGVLPLLFMGNAYEVLLWPVNVSFTAAMAAGIGALLALEREARGGDIIACALLVLALAFSELALSFVLGAAVWMVLARRSWTRAYVVVVPLVLYAAWYTGWGHTAQSSVSVHNLVHSPVYVINGLASSVWSLAGVPPDLRPGGVLLPLLGLGAAAVLWVRFRRPLPASFWSALTILLSFWLLTAASFEPGREPQAPRYQYVGVALLLLVLGNALTHIRLRASVVLAVLAAACLGSAANFMVLRHHYQRLSGFTTKARGALTGIEVAGSKADPNLILDRENTGLVPLYSLSVGPYLSAIDAFGSPAYSVSALREASEDARVNADRLIVKSEHLRLIPVRPLPPAGGSPPSLAAGDVSGIFVRKSCLRIRGSNFAGAVITVPPPGITLRTATGVSETVSLRRFASTFPVSFELQGPSVLLIPDDGSDRPWQLRVSGPGPTRICGIGEPTS